MKVFIFHGAFGNPAENWIPWLKGVLEEKGAEVVVPAFPTPEGQSLSSWEKVFTPYLRSIDSDTLLVGHSLGATLILRILEKLNQPIAGAFLIAPVTGGLGNPEFDQINQTFWAGGFDYQKIKEGAKELFVYHSDSDPYVPINPVANMASQIGAKFQNIPEAGHFNEDAGYTKFELLRDDIASLLKRGPTTQDSRLKTSI